MKSTLNKNLHINEVELIEKIINNSHEEITQETKKYLNLKILPIDEIQCFKNNHDSLDAIASSYIDTDEPIIKLTNGDYLIMLRHENIKYLLHHSHYPKAYAQLISGSNNAHYVILTLPKMKEAHYKNIFTLNKPIQNSDLSKLEMFFRTPIKWSTAQLNLNFELQYKMRTLITGELKLKAPKELTQEELQIISDELKAFHQDAHSSQLTRAFTSLDFIQRDKIMFDSAQNEFTLTQTYG